MGNAERFGSFKDLQMPRVSLPSVLFFFLNISFFFFFKGTLFIYLFIYLFMAVLGLPFCARAFSSCRERGATLHRGARASHYRGLSCCGAQAPDAQAQ